MAGPGPSDVPYAAEFEHVATKHCRTLTPAVVDDNMHKASQGYCYLRDKRSFSSALCNWPVHCGAKIKSTFNWKVLGVYLCLRSTFQLSAKPIFLCLQEHFEIQIFNSTFVVNTTFSRVGVGKQTSAPTGNGLTGYQARPSFADSCWAFALTNPSGLISRRFCRFLNSRRLVSAFSSASQTNILALVRQVSTPYRSTIVIELHWSWCRIQNLKQFLLAAPLQIWSSTITYGRRW